MMPLIHSGKWQCSALHMKGTHGHRSMTESFRPRALDRKKNDTLEENRLGGIMKGC